MKVNKTQALLYIFALLLKRKSIAKKEVMSELEISDLTFRRYMQEMRAFLANFSMPYELVYDRVSDEYYFFEQAQ